MAVELGRKGWLGVALEATAGVPVTPAAYVPYTENTLQGKHEPIGDTAAYGIRDEQSENSTSGQKRGEGTIAVNLDTKSSPYFLYGAMGTLSTSNDGNGVYTHTFSRNNSNTPKTLSLTFDKSVTSSRELFTYSTLNSFNLSFSTDNEFAIGSAEVLSRFPVTTTSGTLATTSGTLLSFKDAEVQLGTSLSDAEGNACTKVDNFSLTVNNNAESQWRSCSNDGDVDFISVKNHMVEGEMTIYFENVTERDNFYNLTKQAAIITLTGDGIGGGLSEFVKIRIAKFRYQDNEIETGIDDLLAQTLSFTAEYSSTDSKTVDIQVRNRTATY